MPAGPADQPLPLGRGYATFASDSGHQAGALGSLDGTFVLNDEALRNCGGDALKKTRDAAVFLIKARYAVDAIQKAYFAGGSTGGREALAAISAGPTTGTAPSPGTRRGTRPPRCSAATASTARWRSRAPTRTRAKRRCSSATPRLQACDGLDGVATASSATSCAATPSSIRRRRRVNGAPLRCPGGVDTGDTCLSDVQITALKTINTRREFNFQLASGETSYPGYNVWGARPRHHDNPSPMQPTVTFLAWAPSQPAIPMPRTARPTSAAQLDQWIQYGVTRDPASTRSRSTRRTPARGPAASAS